MQGKGVKEKPRCGQRETIAGGAERSKERGNGPRGETWPINWRIDGRDSWEGRGKGGPRSRGKAQQNQGKKPLGVVSGNFGR